jgi:hypothetical protein
VNHRAAGEPARPQVSVIDAVCCVYFCAAGKSALLIDTLTKLGMEILIPAEVEDGVLRKHRAGRLTAHWLAQRLAGHSVARIARADPGHSHRHPG